MNWQPNDGDILVDCAVVFKVAGPFGGLSNMAGGYPLRVNGVTVPSSEALYQACRFPHRPDWQREIIDQRSPMTAKMMAKKDGRREYHSREDWVAIAPQVMHWVLRVKLAQHYDRVAGLLQATEDRPIVEQSRSDAFWGAVPVADRLLRGENRLGRLLMELRATVRSTPRAELATVDPLSLPAFHLLGEPIRTAHAGESGDEAQRQG